MSLTISRSASGLYRWYAAPAATAFLNREKEIDSIKLFDYFVDQIQRGKQDYPLLTFWHQSENAELIDLFRDYLTPGVKRFRLGQADYIERVGRSLILSGTWDEAPLPQAVRATLERATPGEWGTSIRYFATRKENVTIVRGSEIIRTPVYTEGILDENSILPERYACGIRTNMITRSVAMRYTLKPSPTLRGGPGSGNRGHSGRPGEVGGSGGGNGPSSSEDEKKKKLEEDFASGKAKFSQPDLSKTSGSVSASSSPAPVNDSIKLHKGLKEFTSTPSTKRGAPDWSFKGSDEISWKPKVMGKDNAEYSTSYSMTPRGSGYKLAVYNYRDGQELDKPKAYAFNSAEEASEYARMDWMRTSWSKANK